jgi:hypothetical protein
VSAAGAGAGVVMDACGVGTWEVGGGSDLDAGA